MGVKVFRIVATASLILLILLSQFAVFRFIPKVKAQEECLKIYYDSEKGYYYFWTLNREKVVLEKNGFAVLNRWDGEAWIKFGSLPSVGEIEIEVEAELVENKLKWKGKWKIGIEEVEVEIELEPKNISEYGDLEWSMKLTDKPPINAFSMPIQSENLKFYYQPPLYEEYGFSLPFSNSTFFVNATHVMEFNGTDWITTTYRPENVVGSYAIYHAYKMHNEYKTGKAFHIYRPKIIDAEGNEAWCNLNISNNLLKIEIPQEFLDKAVYPVTIDPTFGYTTKGANQALTPGNRIFASWYTCPENGQANSITVYLKQYSSYTPKIKCAIYRKSDGSLIGYTEEWQLTSGWDGWRTFSIISGGNLQAGTDYWLAMWGNEFYYRYYDSVSDKGCQKSATYNDWPDPLTGITTTDNKNSIYCTYTAGGGGDTTPPTYDANTLGTNTTAAGQPCLFHCNWSDDTGLSGFILEHNNTGVLTNETWTSFDSLGTGNTWSNITLTLNNTVGVVIQWRIYANDTSNNWNVTDIQYLTTTFYAEITIQTTSHSWNIMPGQSNVLINEGNITITVTANANFTIQVKGSGDLTCGSHSIPLSNVKVHKDTLASAISLSTSWQDVPGLVNVASGTDITLKFKLWLSVPDGTPAGDYTYTLYIQVVQYNG